MPPGLCRPDTVAAGPTPPAKPPAAPFVAPSAPVLVATIPTSVLAPVLAPAPAQGPAEVLAPLNSAPAAVMTGSANTHSANNALALPGNQASSDPGILASGLSVTTRSTIQNVTRKPPAGTAQVTSSHDPNTDPRLRVSTSNLPNLPPSTSAHTAGRFSAVAGYTRRLGIKK